MYGFEWSFRYFWQRMTLLQRLDIILLALMLAHIVVVVIHVSYRYRLARRAKAIDTVGTAFQHSRRKLVADLSFKVSTLNSIALLAPYLGLAGTSIGIIAGLMGIALSAESALAAVIYAGVVPVAFITSVAGLFVAIPAAWSYNYLRTRMDSLESEISEDVPVRHSRHVRFARKFPLAARFSTIPFSLVAVPILAILAGVTFMEYSFYKIPTGLYVETVPAALDCEEDHRVIVLHVTQAGELFVNQEQEDWNGLANRLSDIYSLRRHRALYLLVDNGVPFQQVADAIDIAKNASVAGTSTSLDITVRLITPTAVHTHCLEAPVPRPSHTSR
jgi:biopolymer transport protein ExbB/TolQ/biopolymer transport protein ExbD